MWGIRQFCFAIMIFLLNTLFSNLSILIFEAFKVWIRYSVIFPDLNDLLQSYKDIHKPHLYNIKKSPKTRCFRGNLLFFDIRLNYLFENVLVSWKALRYRVCGDWCCIPESYGRLLIAAHNYQ